MMSQSTSKSGRSARVRIGAGLFGVTASTGLLLGAAGVAHADSTAHGKSKDVDGSLSGNLLGLPLSAPVQACGDQGGVVSLLNGASDSDCTTQAAPPTTPPTTPPAPPAVPANAPAPKPQLAKTGAKTGELGLTGVSLLVTGAALVSYSRRRRTS